MSGKARSVELTAGNPQRSVGFAATSSAACSQPCALQANEVRSGQVKRKTGHSEVVSAQAETAERQAPCTADGQVPNSLCRERSPCPACRARAFATAISGWHKTTSTLSLTIALVVGLPRSTPPKKRTARGGSLGVVGGATAHRRRKT